MATVSGSRIRKRVPRPASVWTSISPPRRLMFVRTTSMPTPRPAAVVTELGGRQAGEEDQIEDVALAETRERLRP